MSNDQAKNIRYLSQNNITNCVLNIIFNIINKLKCIFFIPCCINLNVFDIVYRLNTFYPITDTLLWLRYPMATVT